MTPLTQAFKEFSAWLDGRRLTLNPEQLRQAEFVKLSFNTIKLNESDPAAKSSALRHHQAQVEKLAAIL